MDIKIEYHADGKIIEMAYTIGINGVKQGNYESYYKNGQLCKKGTYVDEKEEGVWEYYYENGQLWKKCTYQNGEKDGLYAAYYENGQLGEKCFYKNGRKDGPYISYREDGRLDTKYTYKDGKRLSGQEAKTYLKEWNEVHQSPRVPRKILSTRSNQLDKQLELIRLKQLVR